MPRTRIGREITVNRGLPSVMLLRVRKKRKLGRIPVARHEAFQIVPVPCLLLHAQHTLDSLRVGPIATRLGLSERLTAGCKKSGWQTAPGKRRKKVENQPAHANLRLSPTQERTSFAR